MNVNAANDHEEQGEKKLGERLLFGNTFDSIALLTVKRNVYHGEPISFGRTNEQVFPSHCEIKKCIPFDKLFIPMFVSLLMQNDR